MKTHTSKKAIYLRTLLLLPLLAALLYGFSETKTIQRVDTEPQVSNEHLELPSDKATLEYPLTKKPQDGASRKLMAEYNKLAKYYNEMPQNNMRIKKKDVDRLEHIYSLMSAKQKGDAEPFPDFPPMPEPPAPPKAPKVKKGEKSDIPPPPKAPDHDELVQIMEVEEVAKIRANEALLEQQEVKLVAQEILMEKEEAKLEQQEILMEKEEVKMKQQEILMEQQEAKMQKKEAELEERKEAAERVYRKKQEGASAIPEPPIPPSPETPLDHAIEMAKQGATFYYKKEKITSDEAIAILKKNEDLSMDISKRNNESPVVKIDTHF